MTLKPSQADEDHLKRTEEQSIGVSVSDATKTTSGEPPQAAQRRGAFAAAKPAFFTRAPKSILSSLLRIVFVLVAPAALGLGILACGFYQSENEQFSQNVFTTANVLASAIDRELGGTVLAAQVLAESQMITSGDFAGFHRKASSTLPIVHGTVAILADASGRQIVNTLHEFGAPLPPVDDQQTARKVIETGRPAISDLFGGEAPGRRQIAIYVPVTREGQVQYTLAIGISPAKLVKLLRRQRLPEKWAAAIIDSSDVIVAHSLDSSRIGTASALPFSAMAPSAKLNEAKRADGTPIDIGFARSAISGWAVAVSVPVALLSQQPNGILLLVSIGMLCILFAGVMVAVRESARIAEAVQDLIPAALALGDAVAPPALVPGLRETDKVAQALGRAHQLLQQRTSERDQATLSVAERSLADEMFRLAVEACPSGMVMTDRDGKIVMINTEIEQLFGYTRDDLIGQSVDLLVPERFSSQHLRLRQKFTLVPECRHMGAGRDLFGRRKDGSELPIEVGLNPIRIDDDLMVLSVIVDISERKRAERLKDEFVATVSHELRTPLTSISASLGLLAGKWASKLPQSAARLLTIANANSQRLVRLVNDILDIEKMENGHLVFNLGKVALRALVESTIEDNRGFAASYGVNICLEEKTTGLEVKADPDRLAQVITNLLSNAIKFSPTGGEVVVTLERNAGNARICVRDSGAGIPEEFKPQIFEKFAQADATNARKKGGTGLGLSIVKQIVSQLGGTVSFEDAKGGGTVFHVDLAIWDERAGAIDVNAAAAGQPPATARIECPRPRVLHVDDDRDVLALVAQKLRPDVDVVSVTSVKEARQVLSSGQIDLIVLDLALGEDSGIDLLPDLRDSSGNVVPSIIFSGQVQYAGLEDRANSVFSKINSSPESLVAAIRRRLQLPEPQQAKETA